MFSDDYGKFESMCVIIYVSSILAFDFLRSPINNSRSMI